MTTFFDTLKLSFKDVPITADGKIPTAEFLDAAQSLVTLFDILGSSAFVPVQNDMNGNIKKIREYLLANPVAAATLQDLILSEKDTKKKTATQGLLWLTRGLAFTALALRNNINDPSQELTVSFTDSYSKTLSKYHNFVVRGIFSLAMKACPYRKDFYIKLASGSTDPVLLQRVAELLDEWVAALEKIVEIIEKFFESGNYGKGL
ncbi:uncharacterized protein SAPINGB_P004656 [Magnusiomyces paraingens]|uniref:Glycolipid transfer protein domain-containing protein n=1 Tax=Magnusiomyces paraingens TaxID=2606893 RepID=A0A5E8BY73_9ASCO|nr:uncharacterized protein SAPINGB_P004656 [Saprochaete ingens]VVT55579.1 unnamed protein product [Saprochaete ingens]